MTKPFIRIITPLPGVHELWLVRLAADGTIMPVGDTGPVTMSAKWKNDYEEAVRRHEAGADATPAMALPTEPSEEQITAALRAACLHDTRESHKDMRKALIAAASFSAPARPRKATDDEVREWVDRHDLGISGIDARCVFEDAQTLCGIETAK